MQIREEEETNKQHMLKRTKKYRNKAWNKIENRRKNAYKNKQTKTEPY